MINHDTSSLFGGLELVEPSLLGQRETFVPWGSWFHPDGFPLLCFLRLQAGDILNIRMVREPTRCQLSVMGMCWKTKGIPMVMGWPCPISIFHVLTMAPTIRSNLIVWKIVCKPNDNPHSLPEIALFESESSMFIWLVVWNSFYFSIYWEW